MHMAMLISSTITPTVAMGPPSAGIHDHVVDGDCSGTRRTACHESQKAAPTAATIAVMLTVAAASAERRSGGSTGSSRKLTARSASTSSAPPAQPNLTLL